MFFEEWDDPLISGICWVDELVAIAGGEPLFPELRSQPLARHRIVSPDAVAAKDPEVVIASWCGKAVKKRTSSNVPGGSACRPSATTTSTRSSRPTSSSPGPRRHHGFVSCTTASRVRRADRRPTATVKRQQEEGRLQEITGAFSFGRAQDAARGEQPNPAPVISLASRPPVYQDKRLPPRRHSPSLLCERGRWRAGTGAAGFTATTTA